MTQQDVKIGTRMNNARCLLMRLKNRACLSLGAELWAVELEAPQSTRRAWKFTRPARVAGWLLFVARHRHAPRSEGCACLEDLPAWLMRGESA